MHRTIRAMALVFMIFVSIMPCHADITGENGKTIPSATVNIPVKHTITGDKYTGNDNFIFVLTAEDEKNPMPAGASGNTCKVTVTGDEDPDFGDITFEYPDEYFYTITREKTSHEDIETDDSKYSVLIVKYNDGKTQMVMWDADGDKTEDIEFIDIYEKPDKAKSPKTGDETPLLMTAGLFAASVILLALVIIGRKGTDNEE